LKEGNRTAEEEKVIDDFLEHAKTLLKESSKMPILIKQTLPLGKGFNEFRVVYDGYWTYYHRNDAPVRCKFPEDTANLSALPDCTKECWKLLMFRRKTEDVDDSVKLLLPLLKSGDIKSFKHNGDCLEAAKDGYVIVIYTWGTAERDKLKEKLHATGFTNIPYRRGCKAFEKKFGHWKQWYPGDV
jgi:hypothetical protein